MYCFFGIQSRFDAGPIILGLLKSQAELIEDIDEQEIYISAIFFDYFIIA